MRRGYRARHIFGSQATTRPRAASPAVRDAPTRAAIFDEASLFRGERSMAGWLAPSGGSKSNRVPRRLRYTWPAGESRFASPCLLRPRLAHLRRAFYCSRLSRTNRPPARRRTWDRVLLTFAARDLLILLEWLGNGQPSEARSDFASSPMTRPVVLNRGLVRNPRAGRHFLPCSTLSLLAIVVSSRSQL